MEGKGLTSNDNQIKCAYSRIATDPNPYLCQQHIHMPRQPTGHRVNAKPHQCAATPKHGDELGQYPACAYVREDAS
jgi:hypothetical protein